MPYREFLNPASSRDRSSAYGLWCDTIIHAAGELPGISPPILRTEGKKRPEKDSYFGMNHPYTVHTSVVFSYLTAI